MSKRLIWFAVILTLTGGAPVCAQGPATLAIATEEHVVKTKDGWEISIKRYLPKDAPQQECKGAVILCHGFNFNNIFWDIDRRSSLSRYLAKNGYDVWAPSLRGSGLSSKPIIAGIKEITKLDVMNIPRGLAKAPSDITKLNWTIDDHIHKDAPAVVNYVKEKSGFERVYWIGHSMGGLIMYAYLETEDQDNIAGFIPIGSMMVIGQPLSPHLKRIADQEHIITASLIVNTRVAADFSSLTGGAVKYPIEDILLVRDNMHKEALFRLFRECIDDTAPGVVKQFARSIRNGSILSSVSSGLDYNYTENLNLVTVPILILSGGADAFVTKEALRKCYDEISSRDKEIVIFSRENGYSVDYGHSDVVIGKTSEEEVYPVILGWLDERTVGAPGEPGVKRFLSRILDFFKRDEERGGINGTSH